MKLIPSVTMVMFGLGIGLAIGLSRGQSQNQSQQQFQSAKQVQELADPEKLNELKGKFRELSENDIADYIRLKDMRAKYEKADEIFGKILSIFLLDLGLRISGD